MPSTRKDLIAFHNHKGRATQAGIAFHFSFDEWVSWWEGRLGPDWLSKRGCKRGQFVMARHRDAGAYEPSNVRCTTSDTNNSEAHRTKKRFYHHRMTAAQVAEARALYVPFSKENGMRALARKYGVAHGAMQKVIHGKSWVVVGGNIAPVVTERIGAF